jgi:hypothetical protein
MALEKKNSRGQLKATIVATLTKSSSTCRPRVTKKPNHQFDRQTD